MKYAFAVLAVLGLMLVVAPQQAHAVVFTDFVDFPGTFLVVTDGNAPATSTTSWLNWTHDINDNIGGNLISNVTLSNVTLAIRHDQTNGGGASSWRPNGDGNEIGILPATNVLITTTFTLNATTLAALQSDGILLMTLLEKTNGTDTFNIYDSTLSGDYLVNNPGPNDPPPTSGAVPEPASMLLMGVGLAGYGLRLRRRAA